MDAFPAAISSRVLRVALLSVAASAVAAAQGVHVSRVGTRTDGRQIGPTPTFPNHAALIQSMSDDARFVVFTEYLEPAPPMFWSLDVRLLDRNTGLQTPAVLGAGGAPLDGDLGWVTVSGDGNRLYFDCYASNLPGGIGLPNGGLFVLDRATGAMSRVSTGVGGADPTGSSYYAAASPDGRFVLFTSYADNITVGDTNGFGDVFVADMQTGLTTRASLGNGGLESASDSEAGCLSSNGRWAVFSNYGDDLDPLDVNNNASDVYLRDLQTATTHLISVTPTGQAGDMDSYAMWVSDDGRYVAFSSNADDLVPGDTNGVNDFFLRDRQTGTTSLIVLSSSGAQLDDYAGGRFSPDGRYLVFETRATNAVAGDTNQMGDVFVRDLLLSTTQLVTLTPTGGQVTQGSPTTGGFAVMTGFSADGRFVAVYSDYSDLIEGDSNGAIDGFVIDSRSPLAPVTTYCTAKTTSTGCAPVITCAGEPRASGFDSFFVSASEVRTNTRGGFIWSLAANAAPFAGGTLCVATPYHLESVASGAYGGTSGPCNQGQFLFKPTQAFFALHGLVPGTTVFGQFLSRDNGFPAPNAIGLTDAISFTVGP